MLKYPTIKQQNNYVNSLCEKFNSWATSGRRKVRGKVEHSSFLGKPVVVLWLHKSKNEDDKQVLPKWLSKYKNRANVILFARDKVYILKSLNRKDWTKKAAIKTAYELVVYILKQKPS